MAEIAVLGAINMDINLFLKRFPKVGEEVPVKRMTRVPGGKAANISVAAVRILGPGRAALLGCLGRDEIGRIHMGVLEDEGIHTCGIKTLEGVESGQAYILIDEKGGNVICTHFGANSEVKAEDLRSGEMREILEGSSVAVIVDPPLEAVEAAVEIAWEAHRTVMWHPGVRSISGLDRLRVIIGMTSYLILNQAELENMAGTEDMDGSYRRLSSVNRELRLIVTLGEEGCSLIGPEGKLRIEGLDLGKFGMRAVNTVGCGDAFLGVFAAYKAEGMEDAEALIRANAAGALKATRLETRGSPKREELESFLRELNTSSI